MPVYSVVIEGKDFPPRILDRESGSVGFLATRFIEAGNMALAEMTAIELIKDELRPMLGEQRLGETNPSMLLHEITELAELPENAPGAGASWFVHD